MLRSQEALEPNERNAARVEALKAIIADKKSKEAR